MLSQSIIFTLTFLISISSFVTSTEMTYEEIVLFQRRQMKSRLKLLSESKVNAETKSPKLVDINTSENHEKIDDFLRMNSTETIKGMKLLTSHDEIHELHSNLEQSQIYRVEQQIMNMPTTERKVNTEKNKVKISADEKKHKIVTDKFYNDTFGGAKSFLADIYEMKQQWEIEKEEYDSNPLDEHQLHHLYMNDDKRRKKSQHRENFLSKHEHHGVLTEKDNSI